MKTIVCDICGKSIKMKIGELFILEIEKITDGIEDYPNDYSSNNIYHRDYCKGCLKKLGFLLGFKEIKYKEKRKK
ncbi:MAG TPA: hypothetical protein VI911_04960 [Patescibacteria group bacterium]|nr:hypothetical protein [Patescibacteria group bacterium]